MRSRNFCNDERAASEIIGLVDEKMEHPVHANAKLVIQRSMNAEARCTNAPPLWAEVSAGPRYWKLIAYTIARHEGGRRRPGEPVPNRGPKEKPSVQPEIKRAGRGVIERPFRSGFDR